jgi:hypothetical protein
MIESKRQQRKKIIFLVLRFYFNAKYFCFCFIKKSRPLLETKTESLIFVALLQLSIYLLLTSIFPALKYFPTTGNL